VVLALVAVAATYPFAAKVERGNLELAFLDVGQGDGTLVVWPDGKTMLVDGGGLPGAARTGGMRVGMAPGEQAVSAYLWSRGMKRVDVAVLSHPDQDHLLGLAAVLENFEVGELWVGRGAETAAYRMLLRTAERRGTRVWHRKRGDAMEMGGGRVEVLWPEGTSETGGSENNESLVMRVEFGGFRALLTGDIEKKTERRLAEEDARTDVELLKVAHHGSNTSSTVEFLEATTPRVAVIPVGEGNAYRHPHPRALERMAEAGIWPLRTDRDGMVRVVSDGREMRVEAHTWGDSRLPLMPAVRRTVEIARSRARTEDSGQEEDRQAHRREGRRQDNRR
jgi:competence protein ComEC